MKINRSTQSIVLAFLLFIFFPATSWALTLSGVVYGGSAPLKDASVILVDSSSGSLLNSTITDSAGEYSFAVNDGTYNLNTQAPSGSIYGNSVVNSILVNGENIVQNIAAWIHRRRDLAEAELSMWQCLSDRGITEVGGQDPGGSA